ncbi:hypothetical protein LU646_20870, partial [Pseudomonas alloputida]|nr:hypothetical protein [Pseudomonas alloputida]
MGGRISVESVVRCSWNGWPDDRGIRNEGQGHRKKRFHQDDVWDKQGLRKKMWAGQTAPFFCP